MLAVAPKESVDSDLWSRPGVKTWWTPSTSAILRHKFAPWGEAANEGLESAVRARLPPRPEDGDLHATCCPGGGMVPPISEPRLRRSQAPRPRTTPDFMAAALGCFLRLGGVPGKAVTDNEG
jgi:hypothetical protein